MHTSDWKKIACFHGKYYAKIVGFNEENLALKLLVP